MSAAAPVEIRLSANRLLMPVMLGALVVATAFAYRESLYDLVAFWLNPESYDYTHGPILAGMALVIGVYLLWCNPDVLRPQPTLVGAAVLLSAALLWMLSALAVVEVGTRLAFWMLFPALVLAVSGWRGIRMLWLPLTLPLFAIPIWSQLQEPLRLGTAHTVAFLLELGGVLTYLEGSTISIPEGNFWVADNCTGIRQLVVAMPLALLYAGWIRLRAPYVLLALGAAMAVSVAVNTLRILIVVIAGHLTDMQHYFVQEDHITLGWVLFGIGMFAFFFLMSRLIPNRWVRSEARPVDGPHHGDGRVVTVRSAVVTVSLVLVLAFPQATRWLADASIAAVERPLRFPTQVGEWRAIDANPQSALGGHYAGADELTSALYAHSPEGNPVLFEVALYRWQRPGHEAVAWGNRPWSEGWRLLTDSNRVVDTRGVAIPVRESVVVSDKGARRIVWSWYRIAGRETVSDTAGKIAGLYALLCRRSDAAMIVATTPPNLGEESGRQLLGKFVTTTYHEFVEQLENAIGAPGTEGCGESSNNRVSSGIGKPPHNDTGWRES